MEVNKMYESCYKFEVGDIVTFSDSIREAPYEGVGMVFERRSLDVAPDAPEASMQIHVHWFDPKYSAWYAEYTIVLKKVEANNEKY
jgi:hypothetical protein